MKNSPIISIIVPIYNVEKFLPFCIKSIKEQTFTDYECILINDGSTDKSGELCENICLSDARFKVIHQKNHGYQTARNTGLKIAKGNFISFVDADDTIHPQMLQALYSTLINNPECSYSMAYGKMVYNIYQKKHTYKDFQSKRINQLTMFQELFGRGKNESQFQVVWNKLYKKELLKDLYFLNTGSEDTEFNSRVYIRSLYAIIIEIELYYWYQRNTSITHLKINPHYIDRMNSYYICLNNIPIRNYKLRALCLEKLYKTIINIRYYTHNTKYNIRHQAKLLFLNTYKEFYSNKSLELYRKIGLSIFYFLPITYYIFMKLMQVRTKFTRICL